MERRVVNQKLDNLRNCINRILVKMPASAEVLRTDFDVQDIISVNLERAIQSSIDIAAHIGADFDDAGAVSAASMFLELAKHRVITEEVAQELSRASGFRNLLVHRYASIDWSRVYEFLKTKLEVFKNFAAQVDRGVGLK
jgi:uncharacterized protein YutE (UPF0331/DUF86 family)